MDQKALDLLKEAIKDDEIEYFICVEDKKNGGVYSAQHCSPVLLHAIALRLHKIADKELNNMSPIERVINEAFERSKGIDVNAKGENDE